MIRRKNILKQIGVPLLFILLLFSTMSVTAYRNSDKNTILNPSTIYNHEITRRSFIIWDNNLSYSEGLIACQYEAYYGEIGTCADDFILFSAEEIRVVHWVGGFWQGTPAPFDWQITFYNDDGTETCPGTVLAGPFFFLNVDCNEVFLEQMGGIYFYEWTVYLEEPVLCSGGIKYWVGFQGQGEFPPQSGMAVHTSPQQLNQCKFKSELYGYPDWMNSYDVFGSVFDLAFQLYGLVGDTTPPVTTCTVTGTTEKTVTLNATDDSSGVNYTTYKLDDGIWTNYTGPFVVTEIGDHIIYYYSVDNAGNTENEKNTSFTVEQISIDITIHGGFGVSATIQNIGSTNLTNVPYTIHLDGKLIFIGKSKNDTIPTLIAGEEVTVKDFIIGFGKTRITITAGEAKANAEGTAVLFFILGIS
jgi:hypothetical protein